MPTEKQKIDAAVDAFAAEMKARMQEKRREGFKGWQVCSPNIEERLIAKAGAAAIHGQPQDCVDTANLAMIIWCAASIGGQKP